MSEELFSQQHFNEAAQSRSNSLLSEIQSYDMATILNTPLEELEKYFKEKYLMHAPALKQDEVYLLSEPKEVSTTERVRDRVWNDEYVNVNQSYIQFTVCVPFDGDGSLFDLRPNSFQFSLSGKTPKPRIEDNELIFTYNEPVGSDGNTNPEAIYKKDIDSVAANLAHLANDITSFNNNLSGPIKLRLQERRSKAEKNQSIIQSFSIPIKKRDDAPETYSIPEIRKKPKITKTSSKIKTYKPEPSLDYDEYEDILSIVKSLSLMMERSPATFCKLSEEEIRDHFLLHLNGRYEGKATGETFNGVGKTDIIIRHENANAFIAECKFWGGQKKMSDAIDQLLGYITWRDTKTAIIIFNKTKDFSTVIEKAKTAIQGHKNYNSEITLKNADLQASETIFGYKLIHPTDDKKEIFLTLMAFQITDPGL